MDTAHMQAREETPGTGTVRVQNAAASETGLMQITPLIHSLAAVRIQKT